MRRLHPDYLRAAWWGIRSVFLARLQLKKGRAPEQVRVPAVPPVPPQAERAVNAALHRTGSACLVKSVVRQRWYAAQGDPRDLVIGVTAPRSGFEAHAWLEGDDPASYAGFHELRRVPAPR